MVDLSRPWPLGLNGKHWRRVVGVAIVLEVIAVTFDHQLSLLAQGLPAVIRSTLAEITPYGESDWILIPSGALLAVTALLARFHPWKLMRTLLWEFTGMWAFIFLGVGVPSLVSTLVKRIGRPRPVHFDTDGLFGLHPNWFDWTYQSFPSGHATTAFALAACVGFISERWFYPSLALAATIGLSRITEGVHYPSDVIAGAILGLLGAYAVRLFFAGRGWLFTRTPDGRIAMRPMSGLKRYISITRRRVSARKS
jgi:undecaprenyl-diphosphatase